MEKTKIITVNDFKEIIKIQKELIRKIDKTIDKETYVPGLQLSLLNFQSELYKQISLSEKIIENFDKLKRGEEYE